MLNIGVMWIKQIHKNEVFEENKFSPEGVSKPLKGEDTKGAINIH